MHTVVETPSYLRARAGLGEEEASAILDACARDPQHGVVIPNSGGYRKARFAGQGHGKRGDYRIISYFAGDDFPVFLITMFGKGEKSDLSQRELKALAAMAKTLIDGLKKKGPANDQKRF